MTSATPYKLAGKRVWVAGHAGMVGSALVRRLQGEDCKVVTANRATVDLRDRAAVIDWIGKAKPHAIFLAAAKVGGIMANANLPGEFLYDNLAIEINVIEAARRIGVEKLLFLGSSCIYPKYAPQPIAEDALLTGPLEPTNQWYAVAKIAGLKLAEAYYAQYGCQFISAMPTNLYGPGDNFDLDSSHVLPALIRKVHDARLAHDDHVVIWGTGSPLREFMHVDDCADALVFLMKNFSAPGFVNVGTGSEISILELAQLIATVAGFRGHIERDESKPDGTPRKLLDNSKLRALGWSPSIALEDGVADVYHWYEKQAIGRPLHDRSRA